ncbi:MAG TPA: cytochrome C [Geobacteraceae bacterium]|nr:cytochrome C [Geobacteraceae bacterium]
MKRISVPAMVLWVWAIASASEVQAFQCNVCHSRNPAMVGMHKAVQGKGIGCFDCHKVGENLMGKAEQKDRASLLSRRAIDSPCVECHGKVVKK